MIDLTTKQTKEVGAAFKMNIGQAIGALALGFVTGGPVGLGYAASVVIIAQGVNNLEELVTTPRFHGSANGRH